MYDCMDAGGRATQETKPRPAIDAQIRSDISKNISPQEAWHNKVLNLFIIHYFLSTISYHYFLSRPEVT